MRGLISVLALALFIGIPDAFPADPRLVDGVSGAPIAWTDWVAKRGPVAVLVWASWTPEAEKTIGEYSMLAEACTVAGLYLVVLDVQETLEAGREALGDREIGWLHDRHGALLKNYRVIKVPSLVLVAADGKALARLDADADALRAWRRP